MSEPPRRLFRRRSDRAEQRPVRPLVELQPLALDSPALSEGCAASPTLSERCGRAAPRPLPPDSPGSRGANRSLGSPSLSERCGRGLTSQQNGLSSPPASHDFVPRDSIDFDAASSFVARPQHRVLKYEEEEQAPSSSASSSSAPRAEVSQRAHQAATAEDPKARLRQLLQQLDLDDEDQREDPHHAPRGPHVAIDLEGVPVHWPANGVGPPMGPQRTLMTNRGLSTVP